jgi:hypothetical protein
MRTTVHYISCSDWLLSVDDHLPHGVEMSNSAKPIEFIHGRFIPSTSQLPDLTGIPISSEWVDVIEQFPNQSFATEEEAREYDSKNQHSSDSNLR